MDNESFILFVVDQPPDNDDGGTSIGWKQFCEYIEDSKKLPHLPVQNPSKHVERLGKNIWLLNLQGGLPFLARLVAVAESPNIKMPYRYTLLPSGLLQWYSSDGTLKPTKKP